MIIGTLSDSKLLLEILKEVKLVRSIKFFIILSAAALDLAVVSGGVRTDQLVSDAKPMQFSLESSR